MADGKDVKEIEATGTGPLAPKKVKVKNSEKKLKLVMIFDFEVTEAEHDVKVECSDSDGGVKVKVSINGEDVQEWDTGCPCDTEGLVQKLKPKRIVVLLPKKE